MVMVVVTAPVAVMVGDMVANNRAADAADDRADRSCDKSTADSTGGGAANDALFSRLGRAGKAERNKGAAGYDESTHVCLL